MIAFFSGLVLGIIAGLWQGDGFFGVKFGAVIYLCQQVAGSTAGIIGSWAPLFFKKIHLDPGNIAGPLETAF
jgi:Mg/Co/Ni transporter MgtE